MRLTAAKDSRDYPAGSLLPLSNVLYSKRQKILSYLINVFIDGKCLDNQDEFFKLSIHKNKKKHPVKSIVWIDANSVVH